MHVGGGQGWRILNSINLYTWLYLSFIRLPMFCCDVNVMLEKVVKSQ